jgi:hypothetical protein
MTDGDMALAQHFGVTFAPYMNMFSTQPSAYNDDTFHLFVIPHGPQSLHEAVVKYRSDQLHRTLILGNDFHAVRERFPTDLVFEQEYPTIASHWTRLKSQPLHVSYESEWFCAFNDLSLSWFSHG